MWEVAFCSSGCYLLCCNAVFCWAPSWHSYIIIWQKYFFLSHHNLQLACHLLFKFNMHMRTDFFSHVLSVYLLKQKLLNLKFCFRNRKRVRHVNSVGKFCNVTLIEWPSLTHDCKEWLQVQTILKRLFKSDSKLYSKN